MRDQGALLFGALLLLLALSPASAADTRQEIPAPDDVAAPPANAERTASGLASSVLVPGTGTESPGPEDRAQVHYTGWTTDGKMFDSSVVRGEPIGLPLNRVIAGWQEGVQLMVVGEKRRLWIPEELAYKGQDPADIRKMDAEKNVLKTDKRCGVVFQRRHHHGSRGCEVRRVGRAAAVRRCRGLREPDRALYDRRSEAGSDDRPNRDGPRSLGESHLAVVHRQRWGAND